MTPPPGEEMKQPAVEGLPSGFLLGRSAVGDKPHMQRLFRIPLDDMLACLEQLAKTRSPRRSLIVMTVSLVVSWFVYVPIHELLHAGGCVVAGGSISTLEISPQYGGRLLAKVFPFVHPESEYAGRLSGFDTKGSDLIYLATDIAPFLLSILFGVAIVRACTRRARPVLLGVGVVVGLAPFYNLFGDYYEMSSIVVTRGVTVLGADPELTALPEADPQDPDALAVEGYPAAYRGLRSDDVFKLASDLFLKPERLGLQGAGQIGVGAFLTVLSFGTGILFSLLTYHLGCFVSRIFVKLG